MAAAAAGNAPIVSTENCSLLDNVQRIADELWAESGAEIVGAKGYKACRLLSATNAHPQFPIFATALGTSHRLGTVIRICVHALPMFTCLDAAIVCDHASYSYTT